MARACRTWLTQELCSTAKGALSARLSPIHRPGLTRCTSTHQVGSFAMRCWPALLVVRRDKCHLHGLLPMHRLCVLQVLNGPAWALQDHSDRSVPFPFRSLPLSPGPLTLCWLRWKSRTRCHARPAAPLPCTLLCRAGCGCCLACTCKLQALAQAPAVGRRQNKPRSPQHSRVG